MSETGQSGEAPRQWPRWAKLVMISSLLVNFVVLGLFVGLAMRWPEVKPAAPMNIAMQGYGAVVSALPQEVRQTLREEMRGQSGPLRASRQELRELNAAFFETLRAETLTREDLASNLTAQGKIWASFGETSRQVLIEQILDLPLDERRAFADRLEVELKKRWRPRGERDRERERRDERP